MGQGGVVIRWSAGAGESGMWGLFVVLGLFVEEEGEEFAVDEEFFAADFFFAKET